MNQIEGIRAAEERIAHSLIRERPTDLSFELLYVDLAKAGYSLPFVGVEAVGTLIDDVVSTQASIAPVKSYIPGYSTLCRFRAANKLIGHSLDIDNVTAYSAAQYIDSINPLNRITGREGATTMIVDDLTHDVYGIDSESS